MRLDPKSIIFSLLLTSGSILVQSTDTGGNDKSASARMFVAIVLPLKIGIGTAQDFSVEDEGVMHAVPTPIFLYLRSMWATLQW